MKKRLSILVRAMMLAIIPLIMILVATGTLTAQKKNQGEKMQNYTIPCTPDCETDLWQPASPLYFDFTYGSCTFRVYYHWRVACDTYCDLTITSIHNITPPPNTSCALLSPQFIISLCSVELIKHSMTAGHHGGKCTPGLYPDCSTFWRVSNAACWHYVPFQNPVGNWQGSWGYCDETACCLSTYTVCRDQFNQVIVTRTSAYQTYDCPEEPSGCLPACGD